MTQPHSFRGSQKFDRDLFRTRLEARIGMQRSVTERGGSGDSVATVQNALQQSHPHLRRLFSSNPTDSEINSSTIDKALHQLDITLSRAAVLRRFHRWQTTDKAEIEKAIEDLSRQIEHLASEFGTCADANAQRIERLDAHLTEATVLISDKQDRYTAALLSRQRSAAAIGNVVVTEVEALLVGIPVAEWRLAAWYAFRGLPEPGPIRFIEKLVKEGDTVVDIGANHGIVTLMAARCAGATGRVFSFEPTPESFRLLQENIQLNGLLEAGRISTYNIAIADRDGRVPFQLHASDSGHNTLFPDETGTEMVQVEVTTLDGLLPSGTRVDVIKVDAEGADLFVWRGMSRILAENPDALIILEFAPSLLIRAGCDPAAALHEIEASGYIIDRLDALTGEPLPVSTSELLGCFSVNICAHRRPIVWKQWSSSAMADTPK